ncbi:35481_t:CDS:2, partial [Gigaspora margarita]
LDRTISKFLDDSKFGRTWIDVKANKLMINTATNSLYQLSFVFEQIIQLAKAKNAYGAFFYIDIRLNNVVIYLSSENDNRKKEFIDATKPYNSIIIYANPASPIMKRQKRDLI